MTPDRREDKIVWCLFVVALLGIPVCAAAVVVRNVPLLVAAACMTPGAMFCIIATFLVSDFPWRRR